MKIIPNQIDKHLYMLELAETSVDASHIKNKLEQENTPWNLHHSNNNYIGDFLPTDKLSDLYQYWNQFFSRDFKQQLFSLLVSNEVFVKQHPTYTVDWLMKNTKMTSNFYVVSENYKFGGAHVDEPINQIIALGLIYFDSENSLTRGTVFDNWESTHGVVVPSGFEKGWLLINSDKSYHQICNFGPKRYGIKFWVNV
jgi:hypothetical protein